MVLTFTFIHAQLTNTLCYEVNEVSWPTYIPAALSITAHGALHAQKL